ncbi:MAG: YezD family protein [Verrucomicrobiota bacterium]
MDSNTSERPAQDATKTEWLEIVRNNVGNLRFGSVQITVHDGRVTQIESIEKTRFVAAREDTLARKK